MPPITLVAGALFDGNRFAGDHRFIDRARSFQNRPIDRHFFARAERAADSPAGRLSNGTSDSAPSSRTSRAVLGAKPSSALIAALVWLRARSSNTWPKSTSVTMTPAASKYPATRPFSPRNASGNADGIINAATLNRNATPTPMAINVNIFGLRWTTEAQPRTKNGQPPQSTTGVAKRNSIHAGDRRADQPAERIAGNHVGHRDQK